MVNVSRLRSNISSTLHVNADDVRALQKAWTKITTRHGKMFVESARRSGFKSRGDSASIDPRQDAGQSDSDESDGSDDPCHQYSRGMSVENLNIR
jgi:hypothetical protein